MRLLTIFLSIALLGNAGAAVSGLYTYSVNADNASVTITDYPTDATGAIEIPATIDGRSVTSIGIYAFNNCSSLTSVTIPNSVTSIGSGAFRNCTGLTSATIGNSVTSIGSLAFYNCSSLTSVTIPDSVTSIGIAAFESCSSLTSINIPDSVTSIGYQALSGTNLTYSSVDGVKYLFSDSYAFLIDGSRASGDLSLPSDVGGKPIRVIADYAFYNCTSLTSVTIPNSVTSIGSSAFYNCTGLTSVTIPDSVTSIGDQAFRSCTGLTSVTIPNSVTSIGSNVFQSCTGLTSIVVAVDNPNYSSTGPLLLNKNGTVLITAVPSASGDFTIPNSVTSIGTYAFQSCTGLTSITIPNSVTSIGDNAFWNCTNLASIRLQSMTAPTIASDAFLSISAAIIYYPYGATGYAATYNGVPTTDNGFTADDLNTAVASATTQGQQDVVADPASYGLYTSATAQAQLIDLRTGSTMLNISGSNAVLQLQIQRSDDLSTWSSTLEDLIEVELPMQVGKGFYRFAMPQE